MASHQQGHDEGPAARLGDTRAHSLDRPRSSGGRPSLSAHTHPEAGSRNSDVSGTSDFVRATAEHLAEVDARLKPPRHGSADPTPGFAHIDGDVAGSGTGYNETKVDVVCVTCPGADPVETWTRDPLPDGYFDREEEEEDGDGGDGDDGPAAAVKMPMHNGGAIKELAGEAILSPAINRHLPRAGQLWVRQGIRKYVSTARVMLYRHRELRDGMDIASLAGDLLDQVLKSREGLNVSRPLLFIAHSVGGLVVKQALLKSSKDDAYRSILYNCHGVTFFATPHRGSSYLSMKILSQSIQEIMRLQHPLPHSLAHELKLGNLQLQKLHDEFCDIASELQIWTFYETIDSQLSGSGSGAYAAATAAAASEVQFSAPLCSIKSGLVGVRQEQVYSLDSDHAHCASFGPGNPRTMRSYLRRLAAAVRRAEELSAMYVHTPLRLPEHVKVELIGFYDDPDADDAETAVRLYFAKYHLADFMQKGPERCLEERLAKVKRRGALASLSAGRTRAATEGAEISGGSRGNRGLGIWTNVQRMFQPSTAEDSAPPEGSEAQPSPDIVVTRPSPATASRSLPAEAMRRVQSLTVPPLSTPGFDRPASRSSQGTASTMSEPILEETSPKSDRKAAEAEMESTGASGPATEPKEPERSQQQVRAERLSKGSALRDLTAGFSRPDPTQRKFMWIHLPFTNPLWVKDIFNKIGESQGHDFSKLFNTEHWVSKHVQGRHSRSQPSFVKPACNVIPSDPLPSPKPSADGISTTVSKPRSPRLLYVYLPYLNFDTYLNVLRRRYIVQKRMSHGRARPVPKEIAELESLEARVIWQYQGFDPPLNVRRTLDQFGYPSLQDTYARDDDQMLYKLTKESGPVPPVQRLQQQQASTGSGPPPDKLGSVKRLSSIPLTPGSSELGGEKAGKKARFDDYVESDIDAEADGYKEGNVLMVDQLWLWAIDTKTLATFFPRRESRPKEGPLFQQADLRNSVYNELNGDLTGHTDNALDLAAFIVLHAVTVLLDRTSHPDLEIFRIFEEAIGMLPSKSSPYRKLTIIPPAKKTERMTSSLKSFRMQTWKQINIDDSDDPDDPEGSASAASIKRRHKRELEQAERANREHTSALLELRDLEDELTTLHKLFETQTAVVEAMRGYNSGGAPPGEEGGGGGEGLTAHGRAYLAEALASLDEYRAQTVEMLRRVDTTRKDYEKLLEMAQRQAQVDDVRWSRIQTELASAQNRSVMVFTTFTIIFLPLSFFTSVFGMNTLEWGGDGNLPLSTIGSISLPLSAVLIVGSLVAAFSFRVQSVFTRVYRYGKRAVEGGKGYARRLEPQGARDAKARRRVDRERAEYLAARSKDRNYDFWATVRRQRTSEYRIPDVNRKLETGRSTLTPSTWRSKWT